MPPLPIEDVQGMMGEPVNKAFSQNMILEHILDYAIHINSTSVSCKNICSLRLVNKSWLQAITKTVQKSKKALYHIILDGDNSSSGTPFVTEHGKLLDQLVTKLSKPSKLDPNSKSRTFSLKFLETYFLKENHESLTRCLTACGSGLVNLEIILPNGGTLPFIFPRFSFPNLQNFIIKTPKFQVITYEGNNIANLMQSLLTSAENLKEFTLPSENTLPYAPDGFAYLSLPESLTDLKFNAVMNSVDLDILMKNRIPNLKNFKLSISHVPYTDGKLYQVFDKIKTKLKKLELVGVKYKGPPRIPNIVRFPAMENLESLLISSILLELEENLLNLENYFPNLKSLFLSQQTDSMFRKWTENSKFKTVKSLIVELVDDNFHSDDHQNYTIGFDLERMQRLHFAFPNVTNVLMFLNPKEISGLKYMFMEMRQLKKLEIRFIGASPELNSDFGDALLIGAPIEFIAGLRAASIDFLDKIELKMDKLPSIKLLTELDFLVLSTEDPPAATQQPPAALLEPLLSDLSFHFALLEMPKLTHLYLQRRFRASEKMKKKWSGLGRKLFVV